MLQRAGQQLLGMAVMLFFACPLWAQDDPVVMTVNGTKVLRSEFERALLCNHRQQHFSKSEMQVFAAAYADYRILVEEARMLRLDTLSTYRQQVNPMDLDEAQRRYDCWKQQVADKGGLVRPSHILVALEQKATKAEQQRAKQRVDSLYRALGEGADFADLAQRFSDEKATAQQGGRCPWVMRGQLLQEVEDRLFSMEKGQITPPFLSPQGWHIVKLTDKCSFLPYDQLVAWLAETSRLQKLRTAWNKVHGIHALCNAQETEEVSASAGSLPSMENPCPPDEELAYEVERRMVWQKPLDEAEMLHYFETHRKNYQWEEPRFKGIAFRAASKKVAKKVKKSLKGVPFHQWRSLLQSAFTTDEVEVVAQAIFAAGDNAIVDKEVFGRDSAPQAAANKPICAVFGKRLKAPDAVDAVRYTVEADLREEIRRKWMESLRKKYSVWIDEKILQTVNKH